MHSKTQSANSVVFDIPRRVNILWFLWFRVGFHGGSSNGACTLCARWISVPQRAAAAQHGGTFRWPRRPNGSWSPSWITWRSPSRQPSRASRASRAGGVSPKYDSVGLFRASEEMVWRTRCLWCHGTRGKCRWLGRSFDVAPHQTRWVEEWRRSGQSHQWEIRGIFRQAKVEQNEQSPEYTGDTDRNPASTDITGTDGTDCSPWDGCASCCFGSHWWRHGTNGNGSLGSDGTCRAPKGHGGSNFIPWLWSHQTWIPKGRLLLSLACWSALASAAQSHRCWNRSEGSSPEGCQGKNHGRVGTWWLPG